MYISTFNGGISADHSKWSEFGSFFGGIFSAIFSFASFITLIYIFISEKEERAKENEENLFFTYMNIFHNAKNNISLRIDDEQLVGLQVISKYIQTFGLMEKIIREKNSGEYIIIGLMNYNYRELFEKYSLCKLAIEPFLNTLKIIISKLNDLSRINSTDYQKILFSQLTAGEKLSLLVIDFDYFNNDEIIANIGMSDSKDMVLEYRKIIETYINNYDTY